MTRVEFWEPSGETEIPGKGTVRQVFAPHAFDGAVGNRVPFRLHPGGPQIGLATVTGVIVDGDGRGATWTAEVDLDAGDLSAILRRRVPGSFSFSHGLDEDALPARDPLASQPPVIRSRGLRE